MHYRTLGDSETIVSELALGTMTFGAETDEDESDAILRTLEQLIDDLPAAELRLSEAETERLDTVSAPRFDEYPYSGWARKDRRRRLEGGR